MTHQTLAEQKQLKRASKMLDCKHSTVQHEIKYPLLEIDSKDSGKAVMFILGIATTFLIGFVAVLALNTI